MVKKKVDEGVEVSKVKITPMPTAGENPAFHAAAQNIAANLGEEKQKRHRRTKEEIEAEQNALSDSGFEVFRDFIKMLSDNDAVRWGVPKLPVDHFEPVSRQYAMILNYFMPKGKPIYFVCATAGWQTFMMLKGRAEIIDAAQKASKPAEPITVDSPKPEGGGFPPIYKPETV
jgi:hypothetical protein